MVVSSVYVPEAYFKVKVLQPLNLPLTDFEPAFLNVPCVNSPLPLRLGHRVL